ncbi:MAG: hypothetical protein HC945_02115 [Nitrosarchaeum sp.]|nr:hypothetical protein [Nitrosarchaeum sp.]
MRSTTLASILASSALSILACSDSRTHQTTIREYRGAHGEHVTETLTYDWGAISKNRMHDIIYPNGVHVRALDLFDDGTIDTLHVVHNPHQVRIIEGTPAGQDSLILPRTQDAHTYLKDLQRNAP